MLTTPEPATPVELTEERWRAACELLNKIFDHYFDMYLPDPHEVSAKHREWWDHREVAMKAFLHYFNTGVIATAGQIRDRITGTLVPFDAALNEGIGLTASIALEMCIWISGRLQDTLDNARELGRQATRAHADFAKTVKTEDWDLERMRTEAHAHPVKEAVERLMASVESFGCISLKELSGRFGERDAQVFWKRFASRRGDAKSISYITDDNPAELSPLIEVERDVAFSPLMNALLIAVLDQLTDHLLGSELRLSTLRRRDLFLESQGYAALNRLFADQAQFHRACYETTNKQLEHDIVILWRRLLFVVEAKASPPREPFRDPLKAFVRIRDDFRSHGGIQYAYDQGDRLRKKWIAGQRIILYDDAGAEVLKVEREHLDAVYVIALTADDFGLLATDLSALLVKETSEPYPWAVNIFDLETFVDGLVFRQWGPEMLVRYLDQRSLLHGKVICGDELEVAGIFLRDGTLQPLVDAPAYRLMVTADNSDIFDDIYKERHGVGKADLTPRDGPTMMELHREKKRPEVATPVLRRHRRKQSGRNSLCPCGSGRKYKHCHARG
jgi:hypothetical protein